MYPPGVRAPLEGEPCDPPTPLPLTTCVAMLCAALSLHAAQSASTAKDDPIIGTWQLNVAKSNY